MTSKNTLDQIREEEKRAEDSIQKTNNLVNAELSREIAVEEEKLSTVKKSLAKEIKEINAENEQKIDKIGKRVKDETDDELEKIRRIPVEKRRKANDYIIHKIIN